nr:U2 small nuclear ribonucleoprotein A' [Ipomoea batatas]GMD37355.1 U2 small nuclear ribonucleoprotein A' [Ipomoea batatas]
MEANNLFASQEAEEMAKKESVKTFVPGEVPATPEVPKEEQAPKPTAPTPEQIIAIKAAIVNSQTLEEVARLEQISSLVMMMLALRRMMLKKIKWLQMVRIKLIMSREIVPLNKTTVLQKWSRNKFQE